MRRRDTSWGRFASWYNQLLESGEGTYQREVILPNLMRLLDLKKGQVLLDLACGQGLFCRAFHQAGAAVIGVDISRQLIQFAKRNSPEDIRFEVASADHLPFLENQTVDTVTIILAIQNIENVHGTFAECSRVLKQSGRLLMVLNHPAFRIPRGSDWGWDENGRQYRRIYRYMSESRSKILMHPGADPRAYTFSFHRPLQYYFKLLRKNGFCVTRLEEWISHKRSQPGPRSEAEDFARKEIPLFLFIEATKMG